MEEIIIEGTLSDSSVLIGEDFRNYKKYLPSSKVIVLMDDKVKGLYGSHFNDFPIIEIGQSEQIKTLETIDFIMEALIHNGADRKTCLLAVGGGIVCDIAGFAASIYMRGISFGFISTTLLSQVDASVGGKNGVNHKGFKNMIGVFNQPKFVICDPKMLQTLNNEVLSCGFAEIVKHTLIADKSMFEFLEMNHEKALALDHHTISTLVSNSVKIKADIVNQDEKEQGVRRKLNLGHTYGHAVEKVLQISHGQAVSIGLVMAAKISLIRKTITVLEFSRIINLLKILRLPTEIPKNHDDILNALVMDKKRDGDSIHFILLNGIGSVTIEQISIATLKNIDFKQ